MEESKDSMESLSYSKEDLLVKLVDNKDAVKKDLEKDIENSQLNDDDSSDSDAEFTILDSIPDLSTYKSFSERYFTKRYVLNVNGIKNNDIMIMFHSNRIALLCLAPSHFFFKKKEEYNVNFVVGKVDRRKNTVKGKGKKGGQMLSPKSVICKVEYKDGTSFDVQCCMKGSLIEVNEELVKHPELIKEYPDEDGFIAIILSTIANSDARKNELLTHEQYLDIISKESKDGNSNTEDVNK